MKVERCSIKIAGLHSTKTATWEFYYIFIGNLLLINRHFQVSSIFEIIQSKWN